MYLINAVYNYSQLCPVGWGKVAQGPINFLWTVEWTLKITV